MALLTTSQVAERLHLHPSRVRALAAAGRLPSTSTPLGRLFDPKDVERFAQLERRPGRPAKVG